MLLVFMIIAISVTTAATIITLTNSQSNMRVQEGIVTQELAETGIENARVQLLRNTSYTGETLTANGGTVTIVVAGNNPKTITATAQVGNFIRKIQATATLTNGVLTVDSWREVF